MWCSGTNSGTPAARRPYPRSTLRRRRRGGGCGMGWPCLLGGEWLNSGLNTRFISLVRVALIALGIAVVFSVSPVLAEDGGKVISVAPGVSYELIGTYSTERLNAVLTTELKEFSSYAVTYPAARTGVKLYRVTYASVVPEQGGRATVASGLLAVPEVAAAGNPVVSYQHGTVFSKTEVPSRRMSRWRRG